MAITVHPVTFSPRQRQVVELIAQGYSNAEIAAELGISPRTVRAHSEVLRMKLGVRRSRIPFAYRRLTGADPLAAADDAEKTAYR
jgi:DNA-binding NarL/FixJ family response regulator